MPKKVTQSPLPNTSALKGSVVKNAPVVAQKLAVGVEGAGAVESDAQKSPVVVGNSAFVGNEGEAAIPPQKSVGGGRHPLLQAREKAPDATQQVEKQYSDWAKKYDEETASYGWSAPQKLLAQLTAHAPPASTQRVLDIGVGTGLASIPYLEARAQVTGLDISEEMLQTAKQKHPEFHHLDRYNIDESLSTAGVQPGTYDVVLSSGVLHFAADLKQTLNELDSALAPGGTLAFTFIPPQDRAFGPKTKLMDVDAVKEHLAARGLELVHDEVFVAYHDKGKADDPVRYAMIVAKKPGASDALPSGLDRTASVDRARIATLSKTPLAEGPITTTWVPANDKRIFEQSKALLDAVKAQLAAGGDVDFSALPLPTVTAQSAREGKPGVDVLTVLAHPDDESVYTGGTLGALSKNGKTQALAVVTDGGGGRNASGEDLAAMRAKELSAALDKLGVTKLATLGFGDIGKYKDAHRAVPLTAGDTLRAWGLDALVEKLVAQIRTDRPRTVLSFDPTRDPNFSLHGHHMATGIATAIAVHLAADPSAFPKLGKPWAVLEHQVVVPAGSPGGRQTPVAIDPQTKRQALRSHASQGFSLERAIKDPGTTETWHLLQAREKLGTLEALAPPNVTTTSSLSFNEPPLFSLMRNGDATARALYRLRPMEQVHKEATSRPIAREKIVGLIESQMASLGELSAAQKKNLARLREDSTGVVVSGQQTGVLGGPLYSLFKALGAVQHASSLSERGMPAVPVFWLASYDSDLKEVQDAKVLFGSEQKILSLKQKAADKPVGSLPLGDNATTMLDELEAALRQSGAPHTDEAMELARACFTPGATFAGAFSELMFALTKETGLLILDPADRTFASLARPVIERELFSPLGSKDAIEKANATLESIGQKPQVHGTSDRLNVFFVDDQGKRVFLKREADGSFTTGGVPGTLSRAAVEKLLDDSPERFTPSALLRPIVEDQVLPTLSYVGGPAEVSYFAQIGGVYEWAGVPMPAVDLRPSFAAARKDEIDALTQTIGMGVTALLSHPTPLDAIGRAGLPQSVRDAYERLGEVRARVQGEADAWEGRVGAKDYDALASGLASLKDDVARVLDDVLSVVKAAGLERCEKGLQFTNDKLPGIFDGALKDIEKAKANPGFTPPRGVLGKVASELSGLDGQAVKAGRQQNAALVQTLHKLQPAGEPQERTMTIVQLVAEFGLDVADVFLPLSQVSQGSRSLVVVDQDKP
jgi:bacillithiol biosynthesis cysteine-adding enzyme BshC